LEQQGLILKTCTLVAATLLLIDLLTVKLLALQVAPKVENDAVLAGACRAARFRSLPYWRES